MDPVDGFTVESTDDHVTLILTNRYGQADTYTFTKRDALRIARHLLHHAAE